jgi:hypothetical protein
VISDKSGIVFIFNEGEDEPERMKR